MKLKVTLQRPGGSAQDLLITCDAATTVGDLAQYLRLSDPQRQIGQAASPAEPVTIGLVRDGHTALDPRTPLSDSPVRSGSVITVSRPGELYADPASHVAAIAAVVAGPDAGQEFKLSPGTNIVGRIRSSEVRLTDPLVSRQHARLNVSDHVEVIDLGSANGVELNGSLVSREVARPADEIRVGDTVLTVRMIEMPSVTGRADSASVAFIRPPRLAARFQGHTFEVPELPQPQQPQRFPMFMLAMPVIMAAILYLTTRQLASIIFAALSPLMMLGNYIEQRRNSTRVDKAALALFRADLAELVQQADEAARQEVTMRLAEHPSTRECIEAILHRTPLLWTRRPDDWGFLELRLGAGRLPSRSTIVLPDARRGPRDLLAEATRATAHLGTVDGVPVVGLPVSAGGLGVAGARGAAVSAARALVIQAAALHSPAELAIAVLASSRSADDWDWVKWLPHADGPTSPVAAEHLASTPAAATQLTTAVEAVIDERTTTDAAPTGDPAPVTPAVLLVVESDAPVEFGRLVAIAERGWPKGVHVLWVAPELAQLPAACRTYVEAHSLVESGVGYVHEAGAITPVPAHSLPSWTSVHARRTPATCRAGCPSSPWRATNTSATSRRQSSSAGGRTTRSCPVRTPARSSAGRRRCAR